jgi:hypothetical protein
LKRRVSGSSNLELVMKTCSKCKSTKTLNDFNKLKASKDGHQAWCKDCLHAYARQYRKDHPRKNTPEVARRGFLKFYHGITPEKYDQMLLDQKSKCLMCSSVFTSTKATCVNHDRKHCIDRGCGKCVRGLMCPQCSAMMHQLDKMNLTLKY